jgi:predicted GH43/DUF377 family glycosyl hydrolase
MHWEKFGRIYTPRHVHEKLFSHAANPLAIQIDDDIFRVYYSARDANNRSSVSYINLDIKKQKVIYVHDRPVFEYGDEASFYSHGVSIGNVYQADGKTYMLFMGWQNHNGTHWRGDIGRLIVLENGCLILDSDHPFLGLDNEDTVSLSYPWVEKIGSEFHMWYGSTVTWDTGNQEMEHVIKYAYSTNGHDWIKHGQVISSPIGIAQAFSRPTVISLNEKIYMWFSYRSGNGTSYRIGRADSSDGKKWELNLEESGIDVSSEGWDSEMIEYPFVFNHGSETYMLYNGNSYGQTGFGIAKLIK